MPEVLITDSMIARQLKITKKAMNKAELLQMIMSPQSSPESRFCKDPYKNIFITSIQEAMSNYVFKAKYFKSYQPAPDFLIIFIQEVL